jgi:hypothetical protein
VDDLGWDERQVDNRDLSVARTSIAYIVLQPGFKGCWWITPDHGAKPLIGQHASNSQSERRDKPRKVSPLLGCHPVKMLGQDVDVKKVWGILVDGRRVANIRKRVRQCVKRAPDRFQVGDREIIEVLTGSTAFDDTARGRSDGC